MYSNIEKMPSYKILKIPLTTSLPACLTTRTDPPPKLLCSYIAPLLSQGKNYFSTIEPLLFRCKFLHCAFFTQGNWHPLPPPLALDIKSASQGKGLKILLNNTITHLTFTQSQVKHTIIGRTTTVLP